MTARSEAGAVLAAPPALVPPAVQGRSPGQIAWLRLKRDRAALGGAVFVLLLVLVAVLAPLVATHHPNQLHTELLDGASGGLPAGELGGISREHWLGIEPVNGRDVFSRVVYGARISLLIAVPAALLSVVIGTVVGMTAGLYGGKVDAALSRLMDVLLAFPVVVFAIALISVAEHLNRIALLIGVIGFFGWPFVGRLVRGQTLSLREKEFVEAARSLGAGNGHVIFRQLLPNLVSPVLVIGTLVIPVNILSEAALSFLGIGIAAPTASWGQMLATAVLWSPADPMFMVAPGAALFVTVLAFNLLGDGLRDALDPRAAG